MACKGVSAELVGKGLKEWRALFVCSAAGICSSSRMDRLGTASGAGAFHRPPLYTSSKHLKNPPPNPTHAAAAFAKTDGCLGDHGRACGQGGDAGREGGSGVGHCSRGRGWWLCGWHGNGQRVMDLRWQRPDGWRGRGHHPGNGQRQVDGRRWRHRDHRGTRQRGTDGQQAGGVRRVLGTGHGVRIGLRVGWHRRRRRIWNMGRQQRLGPNRRCRRGGHGIVRAEGSGHGVWRHGQCWQQQGSHRRRPRPNGRDSRQQRPGKRQRLSQPLLSKGLRRGMGQRAERLRCRRQMRGTGGHRRRVQRHRWCQQQRLDHRGKGQH